MADRPQHPDQALDRSTHFDLSDAIRRWKASLAGSPAFRPGDLDELEAHLRDSVASLEAKGLFAREAFWIALSRMGTPDALDAEFGKVNANRVWLERALWMVAGSLGLQAVASLVSVLASLSTIAAGQVTQSAGVLAPLGLVVYLAASLAVLVALWRSGQRGSGPAWRFAAWMKAHPVAGAVGVGVFFAFNTVSSWVMSSLAFNTMPMSTYALTLQWRFFSVVMPVVFWPAVLAWLLKRSAPAAKPA